MFVGYPLLWETLTRGRSPGKYAMGLRVVRTDGGPIVFRHALARALAGFIVDFGLLSLFTGLIGIVVSASTARGQRIGDLLAGTVVVRERLPRTGLESLPPPDPGLAAWAGAASSPASPTTWPSPPASSSSAPRSSRAGCGRRWPSGSRPTSPPASPRPRRRACRPRPTCSPCWASAAAARSTA